MSLGVVEIKCEEKDTEPSVSSREPQYLRVQGRQAGDTETLLNQRTKVSGDLEAHGTDC